MSVRISVERLKIGELGDNFSATVELAIATPVGEKLNFVEVVYFHMKFFPQMMFN